MGKSMKVIKGYFLSFFGLAVLLVCMKGMIVHAADESNIRELFSQGQVAFDEGQDDHALRVFDKITQTSGREEWLIDLRSRAFVEKSRIYYRQHAYLPAIDNCYFAILESPNFFDAHYHRGKAYLARHDYDKAIRTFTRATQIDPESAYDPKRIYPVSRLTSVDGPPGTGVPERPPRFSTLSTPPWRSISAFWSASACALMAFGSTRSKSLY